MAETAIVMPPTQLPDMTTAKISTCTQCGSDTSSQAEATQRIKDLEAQVRQLNTKAAAAVDKITDYDDELRTLRAAYIELQTKQQQPPPQTQPPAPSLAPPQSDQHNNPPTQTATPTTTPPISANPSSPPRHASRLASLTSFLPTRKRDTALLQQTPTTPSTSFFPQTTLFQSPGKTTSTTIIPSDPLPARDILSSQRSTTDPIGPHPTLLSLQTSLETERTLRLRAETDLTQTQSELEELTATLFGQANEMVATERKARAKLEERVKVLEDRDGEKRRRLERLEKALERIERVRGLISNDQVKGKGLLTGVAVQVSEVKENSDGDSTRLRVVNVSETPPAVAATG